MTTTYIPNEEEAVFLSRFQEECNRYLTEYKQGENPKDPSTMFWTRSIDHELALKAGGISGKWDKSLTVYMLTQDSIRKLEKDMSTWFIAQASIVPKAPEVDLTPIKVKYWVSNHELIKSKEYDRETPYKPIIKVGQILIQPSLWRGTKTWEFSEAYRGMLFVIKLEASGSKENKAAMEKRAIELATKLNGLCDFEQFSTLPWRARAELRNEILKLRVEYAA